jgi:hypothetical protein
MPQKAIYASYSRSDLAHGVCHVSNSNRLISISESLLDMNEIECARCGWNWIMLEGQTVDDCPFCPKEPGGFVFVTET